MPNKTSSFSASDRAKTIDFGTSKGPRDFLRRSPAERPRSCRPTVSTFRTTQTRKRRVWAVRSTHPPLPSPHDDRTDLFSHDLQLSDGTIVNNYDGAHLRRLRPKSKTRVTCYQPLWAPRNRLSIRQRRDEGRPARMATRGRLVRSSPFID